MILRIIDYNKSHFIQSKDDEIQIDNIDCYFLDSILVIDGRRNRGNQSYWQLYWHKVK